MFQVSVSLCTEIERPTRLVGRYCSVEEKDSGDISKPVSQQTGNRVDN